MKVDTLGDRQRLTSKAILWCIGALLLLIGLAVNEHPVSIFPGDLYALTIIITALAIFGVIAVSTHYAETAGLKMALLVGATVGALQGVTEMANIAFEYSAFGSKAIHTIAVPLSMATMILLFSGAGSVTYNRTSSLRLSALAGTWCAVVGTFITALFGFSYNMVLMPHMVEITHTGFALSGLADPQAYVVRNTIESASTHFYLAPLLGVMSGCVSGFVSSQLRRRSRLLAVIVGALSVGVLASAVALIRFGLNLARDDRAPYIGGGMIGSALALVCLWPAARAALSHHRPQRRGLVC